MLYDSPPHLCDVYTSASGTDAGGGTDIAYTLAQSNVPCIANSLSAGEQARFAQSQIALSHKVCFKASALTAPIVRGNKLVVNGASLHVKGVNSNQAVGNIPELVEVMCEQLL